LPRPLPQRGASRLLVLDDAGDGLSDRYFADLPSLLRAGDLLVLNDTRVIRARLFGRKSSGGRVELLVERVVGDGTALVRARTSKPLRAGGEVLVDNGARLSVLERHGEFHLVRLETEGSWDALFDHAGHVPLPPYIRRADDALDDERYQTVYASQPGAVAAPTAGLHFDADMLERLAAAGVEQARVTLHVGSGTFQPLREENLSTGRLHEESLTVSAPVCEAVSAARARGGRVVAVGTTTVRALESASLGGALEPFEGETDLFIREGFEFRVVDAMVTNFHLPESSLLMLVSAFAGRERVLAAYRHAVAQRYRFFSYGDAMFVSRR
jgi:S-adenosylmethionine:tRNA ribosyltransferase-isomerase